MAVGVSVVTVVNGINSRVPRVQKAFFFLPLRTGAFIVAAWLFIVNFYTGLSFLTPSYAFSSGFSVFIKLLGAGYLLVALGAFYGGRAVYNVNLQEIELFISIYLGCILFYFLANLIYLITILSAYAKYCGYIDCGSLISSTVWSWIAPFMVGLLMQLYLYACIQSYRLELQDIEANPVNEITTTTTNTTVIITTDQPKFDNPQVQYPQYDQQYADKPQQPPSMYSSPDNPQQPPAMYQNPQVPTDATHTPVMQAPTDTTHTPVMQAPTDTTHTPVMQAPTDATHTPIAQQTQYSNSQYPVDNSQQIPYPNSQYPVDNSQQIPYPNPQYPSGGSQQIPYPQYPTDNSQQISANPQYSTGNSQQVPPMHASPAVQYSTNPLSPSNHP